MNKKGQTLKTKFYILSLFAAMMIAFGAVAQPTLPPWTVTQTTDTQVIVLQTPINTVDYDGSYNTSGDAIGVFYDQAGTLVCGGYMILNGFDTTLTVYGDTGGDNGFQTGEIFHFMYWRQGKDCVIDMPGVTMSNNQYSYHGVDTLYSLSAIPAIVQYPEHYYCKWFTGGLPIPLQIGGISFTDLNININPTGFDGINPLDGSIEDLNAVLPNSYLIQFSSDTNTCFRSDTFRIVISYNLFSDPDVTVTQPTCDVKSGTIDLDTTSLINGALSSLVELKNLSTGQSVYQPSGLFKNLAPGNYQLILRDQYSCADTLNYTINNIPGDCEISILAPLQNGEFSEVYLPWPGQTKIYNSQGQLINSFTTPAKWDGRDQSGQYVKTGAYFIFTDGEKKQEITVIY